MSTVKMKTICWKCKKGMKPVKDNFHGFSVAGWKCPNCMEIIYDERAIHPILEYFKMKAEKKGITATVGVLGESKILRIPRIAEQLYKISKGEKLRLELKPEGISIKIKA